MFSSHCYTHRWLDALLLEFELKSILLDLTLIIFQVHSMSDLAGNRFGCTLV